MSIEGQGNFFTIYFPGFVCFVLYLDKISGERLQDHWSSGCHLIHNVYEKLKHVCVVYDTDAYAKGGLFVIMVQR